MRDDVFAELKSTVYFTNRSEVWGHLFGTIDTRDKFRHHRLELALHEWARFKANDSLECRNCHSAESMDITKQSPPASDAHQRFLFKG